MGLTAKQQAFVEHYSQTGNATQSAILAGYSENGASVQGSNLLRHAGVARALAEIERRKIGETVDRVNGAYITRQAVLDGLRQEATSTGTGTTHAARVSAWRAIADIEGYTKNGDSDAVSALSALRIEIVQPDGAKVKVEAGQAVKQLGKGKG